AGERVSWKKAIPPPPPGRKRGCWRCAISPSRGTAGTRPSVTCSTCPMTAMRTGRRCSMLRRGTRRRVGGVDRRRLIALLGGRRRIGHQRAAGLRLRDGEPAVDLGAGVPAVAARGAALVVHHALARIVDFQERR